MLKKRECRRFFDRTLDAITLGLFCCGGMGLVGLGGVHFALQEITSVHDFLMKANYILLGLSVGLSGWKGEWLEYNFRFLNYHWGRSLLSFFLSSIAIAGDKGEQTFI